MLKLCQNSALNEIRYAGQSTLTYLIIRFKVLSF